MALFQDHTGSNPGPESAPRYWEAIDDPAFPVLADPEVATVSETPYGGDQLPGKCVLTPEMEILHCYAGDGDEAGFAAIVEHADSRQ